LFHNFNCSYYNFEFFKQLQFDLLRDQFVSISVQAEKEAELMEMVSRVENIWRVLAITTVAAR
jgi:hypothetical protein